MPVLQARGLIKRYGNVTALDGCDFEVLPGEILAVIGDNGAGKSSLIKALSGATVPDAGEILQSTRRTGARYRDRVSGTGGRAGHEHRRKPVSRARTG
jgi:ABC-type sugar transport system ATPase subunit